MPILVHRYKKVYYIFYFTILLIFLSSCSRLYDPESSQDQHNEVIAELSAGNSFTQSFGSKNSGMSQVEFNIYTIPQPGSNPGKYTISLVQQTGTTKLLYKKEILFESSPKNTTQIINIQPDYHNQGAIYLLTITANEGVIQLLGKNDNIYPEGNANLNGSRLEADLGIKIFYQYGLPILMSDIKEILPEAWLSIPVFFILFVPGMLLLSLSGFGKDFDIGEQIALSIGLSISFFAILLYWTTYLHLSWTESSARIFSTILFSVFLFIVTKNIRLCHRFKISATSTWLLITFMISVITRFIMIRDMATPAWVDSVHHALITRLIAEHGALPSTLQPYLDVSGSSYHNGLHSLFAFFYWITGLKIHRLILVLGQVLNACIVFPVYLFCNQLVKNKHAALASAIFVAVFSPMPAYYTSWGRYPQLAGIIIFPACIATARKLWEMDIKSKPRTQYFLLAGLLATTIAGLSLTHYRVAIFSFIYFLIEFSLQFISPTLVAKRTGTRFDLIPILILPGAFLIFIMIPWIIHIFPILRDRNFIPSSSIPLFQGISGDYLTSGYGWIVLAIAAVGLFIGLLNRKIFLLILALWVAMLFFIANLGFFKLPGGSLVNNNSVVISLFLPISVLAGYAIGTIYHFIQEHIGKNFQKFSKQSWFFLTGAALLLGSSQIITILNPITFISREADITAAAFVEKYTKKEDTILINPFLWGYNFYAGSDGGYWLSVLAHRKTMPPPIIYGMSNSISYKHEIREIASNIIEASKEPGVLAEIMRNNQIKYLYLGARGGIISASIIQKCNEFIEVFHQDDIWLFQVTSP